MTDSNSGDTTVDDSGGVDRAKVMGLVAGAVLLVVFGVLYMLWASARVDDDIADREARAQQAIQDFEDDGGLIGRDALDAVEEQAEADAAEASAAAAGPGPQPGEVVVVHRVPGDDYGRLAIRHVDGSRTLLERRCLRVHLAAGTGVCMAENNLGVAAAFETQFFDASDDRLVELRSYASPLPSRARISPDGSRSSTTGFVSGSGYADIGGEAETIVVVDEIASRDALTGLVQFEVLDDDDRYSAADRQFWGLSFDGNDDFWITGFFGEEPEIMQGTLSRRTLSPTGMRGSCPSLSPDGSTLVFKETQPDGTFQLTAVDLATERRWPLGETRSVDDQVEWLDDDTILYAVHPEGTEGIDVQPQFDIWMLDIAEGSEPELFLPAADSPAVIRP